MAHFHDIPLSDPVRLSYRDQLRRLIELRGQAAETMRLASDMRTPPDEVPNKDRVAAASHVYSISLNAVYELELLERQDFLENELARAEAGYNERDKAKPPPPDPPPGAPVDAATDSEEPRPSGVQG